MGDTLAKWYEGNALVERLEETSVCIDLAHLSAKQCKSVLIENSMQALTDLENGSWTNALKRVIETNIVTSGLVGGFGNQYLRIAGAHSIHNGMTKIPHTHHLLHGEKVAYGILVQLVLENKFEELEQLLPFYESVHLPSTLADIGLTINQQAELLQIARFAVQPGEDIYLLFPNITVDEVLKAMTELENLMTNYVK
ncbi:iron-containing alcohol dehydrogenase [Peribacillus asahii]|nr:iron-containing alcohol dehydrogenase [Peribacillus asahii]USK87236.1 iron-containing alcohol dehydrogenase [Peribacillus asahii]